MHKVISANTHIWCCLEEIMDTVFVRHTSLTESGVCTFGGKWVENSFCIQSQNIFSVYHNGDLKVEYKVLHHAIFCSFAHHDSPSYISHSYNYRIYIGLCKLYDHINRILHTKRIFQKNGFRSSCTISAETWNYLELKLKGRTMCKNYKVSKVRRLFLDNLSQRKKRFHEQSVSSIEIDTQEILQSIRKLLGCSFGVGVRVVPRLKDKVIGLGIDQHLNAVWTPSVAEMNLIVKNRQILKKKGGSQWYGGVPEESLGDLPVELPIVPIVLPELTNDNIASCSRKLDVIQILFDHTTSTAAISIVFT